MKKDFLVGILTGAIIVAFLCSALYFGKVFFEKARKDTITNKTTDYASNSGDARRSAQEEMKNNPSVSKNYVDDTIDTSYVFENDSVVKKAMDIEDIIDTLYIENVSEEDLAEGVYDGLLEALGDPYADYYTAEEYKEMLENTTGVYYGIGCYLTLDEKYLYPKITEVMDESPALEVDLKADDFITKADGVDLYGMELDEAVKHIKGPENTKVLLTVVRQSTSEEFEIEVERRKIETPTVECKMLDDEIGYIRIKEFDEVTADQFKDALATVKGSDMKGLILDLRSNPGGSVRAVVDIAGQILPKGVVVYTEDKYGNRTDYNSDGKTPLDIPMVVLINGNSASASEILTGAIKDYEIGTVMGTTSYGKGIVQQIIPLGDGSAVKLTVSHYYTPNGNDIHKKGIEPDVKVEFDTEAYIKDENSDNQLDEAIKYIKKELK